MVIQNFCQSMSQLPQKIEHNVQNKMWHVLEEVKVINLVPSVGSK